MILRSHLNALAIGLLVTGGITSAALAEPSSGLDLPIPEHRTGHTWTESQRIRYHNTPLMKRVVDHISKNEDAAAEPLLRKVLERDPDNNHAKVYLLEVLQRLKRPEEGIPLAEELVTAYPDFLEGWLDKGFLCSEAGRVQEAIDAFENMIRRAPLDHPRRAEAEQNLAQLHFRAGEFEKAQVLGRKWAERDNSAAVQRFLLECAIRLEQWDEALLRLDEATSLSPKANDAQRGELLLKRGFLLTNAGRADEAEKALIEARELLPGTQHRLEITKQLGFNAMKLKHPAAAANYFKAYLIEHHDEAIARAYLDALMASKDWNFARVEARRLIDIGGNSKGLEESALAVIMHSSMNLDDHLMSYTTAQQLYHINQKPVYLLESATAAEKMGQDDEAIRLYRMYLDREFSSDAAMNYYYLLKRNGEAQDAETLLRKVIEDEDTDKDSRAGALYELAQICREKGLNAEYLVIMDALLKEKPESRFFKEYADRLYAEGRFEEAAAMFDRSLEGDTDPASKYATCVVIAELKLALLRPEEAKLWLNRALEHGEPGIDWHLAAARADYQQQNFKACVDRLLPFAGQKDVVHLYMGFAFYRLDMPGLALMNLNRVADPSKLTPQEQFTLFSNRAYMHFDQDQNEAALKDLDHAMSFKYDDTLAVVRLKTLLRLGRFEEVVAAGNELISTNTQALLKQELESVAATNPDEEFRNELLAMADRRDESFEAEVLQLVGLAHFRMDNLDKAVESFDGALDREPARYDILYLRGLTLFKQGEFKAAETNFIAFYETAEATDTVPPNFWGDMGVLAGDLKDFDLGTAALATSQAIYPSDVDSSEEVGYQYMKWNKRNEAQASFSNAIAIYNDVLPNLKGKDEEEYSENSQSMKKEYSKLDKVWGAQAYISKTDLDAESESELPIQTIEGALPAQAGVFASYRPPKIGFRNEKNLDIYGRVLANFKPDSWDLDEESYQGGVGLSYKPFAAHNFNTSIERLFKIGDNSENNWLWRNLAAWEYGEKPPKDRDFWLQSKLYGELSFFLDDPERWIYYLDGRVGLSLSIADKVLLTLPQGMAIARYQSDDDTGLGTYTMLGLGANLRFLEREKALYTERWYLDAYAHYVWGWFDEEPQDLEDNAFEGVIFGVNFVK